jgi:hypothetical protein
VARAVGDVAVEAVVVDSVGVGVLKIPLQSQKQAMRRNGASPSPVIVVNRRDITPTSAPPLHR